MATKRRSNSSSRVHDSYPRSVQCLIPNKAVLGCTRKAKRLVGAGRKWHLRRQSSMACARCGVSAQVRSSRASLLRGERHQWLLGRAAQDSTQAYSIAEDPLSGVASPVADTITVDPASFSSLPCARDTNGRTTRSRSAGRSHPAVGVETPDISSAVGDSNLCRHGCCCSQANDCDAVNDNSACRRRDSVGEERSHIAGDGSDGEDNAGDGNIAGDVDGVSCMGDKKDSATEVECDEGCCFCAGSWSCGGHAKVRRTGVCCSTPKFSQSMVKRRFLCIDDEDMESDVSPVKRCRKLCGLRAGVSLSPLAPTFSKAVRQRIPSREHPPDGLSEWLHTFTEWSNADRLMALDDLIVLCEPSQVRHVMHVIEPQFQRDFISLLPKELALYVLFYLEPKDLLRAAQTCRNWNVLCEDNLLWREKCREEGINEMLVYGSRLRRRPPGARCSSKSLYMRQCEIEHNWREGTTRAPRILKGHDDHVITCLEFCGQRIVSGSDDNTLKVWSVVTGKCLRNLISHTGGVWSSQMSGNIIISGSTDRTLKVWNADTGALKFTLYGHSSTVRCMALHKNTVVSGSRDATLRVWDINEGMCLHTLLGHVAAVRCVQFDGQRVVSGAYDYTVRVWNPDTETCLHSLQGHSNRVYSLQFDGTHIVSGSLDTSIRVWDVETGACLHTLIGHQSLTSGLELKDNVLVSGNADSTVKVWDITTGQCLQTLQGPNKHQSAVTCLQFSKRFVVTSSDDGTVKIWDLKTGEFIRNLVSLASGGSGGVVWRLRCSNSRLVCAVGSRNGTEETKLMVLDFDVVDESRKGT